MPLEFLRDPTLVDPLKQLLQIKTWGIIMEKEN